MTIPHLKAFRFGLLFTTFAACAPAWSQPVPSVTVYGRLNTAVERVSASNSSVDLAATRLSNYRSVLGFRGEEDLGGGLRAVWQIEGALSLDTGTATSFANRDTRIGLAGAWGTVFMGHWTLPYTSATASFDPFYPTTAGYMSIIGNGSAPSTDHLIDTSSFDRRQRNVIQYGSPSLAGFAGRIAYGLNEGVVGAGGGKPSLLSVSGTYEAEPLVVTAAHEIHRDYQAPGRSDTGTKVGAAWRIGDARIAGLVERLRYETATGTLTRDAWYLSGTYAIGAGSLRAGYSRAGNGKGTATETIGFFRSGPDTGSSQWTVGYEHLLSKRTAIYGYYSRIVNDAAAVYDFAINELGVSAGARPSVLAFGMRHSF